MLTTVCNAHRMFTMLTTVCNAEFITMLTTVCNAHRMFTMLTTVCNAHRVFTDGHNSLQSSQGVYNAHNSLQCSQGVSSVCGPQVYMCPSDGRLPTSQRRVLCLGCEALLGRRSSCKEEARSDVHGTCLDVRL